jgi:tetratricopeptide (TPR) repeat protein
MDPNNPIIKLCVEGMQAEAAGKAAEARLLFIKAWEQKQNDFEACIAAHYGARHQETPQDTLTWNQIALDRATRLEGEEIDTLYPSLYLNLGKSHEDMGNLQTARKYYELADSAASTLAQNRYGNTVRDAIARGLHRVA